MDKYEITDDLLFQHCTNVENFILEQIPDEEDIDYESFTLEGFHEEELELDDFVNDEH